MAQSNVPLSTTQIVNHFINQNNKVQFDNMAFLTLIILDSFIKTPNKKTMNCNNDDMCGWV